MEDKVLKHYRLKKHYCKALNKHYEVKRLLKEFLKKDWTKGELRHLLRKIYKTKDSTDSW